MNVIRHEPPTGEGSALVYAPYAWGGSRTNTPQYPALARLSGFTVLTASAPGTGRVIIDRPTRRTLHSGGLRDVAGRHADVLRQIFEGDERKRIVLGDSGRGSLAAWLCVEAPELFNAALIRDGVNLNPAAVWRKAVHLLLHAYDHSTDETSPSLPAQPRTKAQLARTILHSISEMHTYGPVMAGDDSMIALQALARYTDVPFANVTLGHGLAGTEQQALTFSTTLGFTRSQSPHDAPFLGIHEPTWGHGNLRDPYGAARHLEQLTSLLLTI